MQYKIHVCTVKCNNECLQGHTVYVANNLIDYILVLASQSLAFIFGPIDVHTQTSVHFYNIDFFLELDVGVLAILNNEISIIVHCCRVLPSVDTEIKVLPPPQVSAQDYQKFLLEPGVGWNMALQDSPADNTSSSTSTRYSKVIFFLALIRSFESNFPRQNFLIWFQWYQFSRSNRKKVSLWFFKYFVFVHNKILLIVPTLRVGLQKMNITTVLYKICLR